MNATFFPQKLLKIDISARKNVLRFMVYPYLPVFVMIISVPSSLNLRHKSSFSNLTETFLLFVDPAEFPRPEIFSVNVNC